MPVAKMDEDSVLIRGFKDTAWTPDSMALLDYIFPCSRKIWNVRGNHTAQEDSRQSFNNESVVNKIQVDNAVSSPAAATSPPQPLLSSGCSSRHSRALGAGSLSRRAP